MIFSKYAFSYISYQLLRVIEGKWNPFNELDADAAESFVWEMEILLSKLEEATYGEQLLFAQVLVNEVFEGEYSVTQKAIETNTLMEQLESQFESLKTLPKFMEIVKRVYADKKQGQ